MSKTSRTYHEGAAAERKAVLSKLRRMNRQVGSSPVLADVIDWVSNRHARYAKRKGGL